MISPIVGLVMGSVGLVPTALKLIDFWADFIHDARHCGSDAQRLSLRFEQLSLRYKSLQSILFDEAKFPFVQGPLFNSLPQKEQSVITGMLRELPRLLYEHYLVARNYAVKSSNDKMDKNEQETALLTPEEQQQLYGPSFEPSKQKPPSFGLIRNLGWAIRTKHRVETLIQDYESWLGRIQSCLETCWWPLSLFDKYLNVRSIERDHDCVAVGVSKKAALRKLLVDDAHPEGNDLGSPKFNLETLGKSLRGIFELDNESVLIEMLTFQPDADGFLSPELKNRFRQVTGLLQYQNDEDFHVLKCKGYFELHGTISGHPIDAFVLVSHMPSGSTPEPKTLLELFTLLRGAQRPPLEERINLCYILAQSISLFHSVGWIHRSFRSDNVIYFWKAESGDSPIWHKILLHPRICGFEASRLSTGYSLGYHPKEGFGRDIYRHPDRWGVPRQRFNNYHDIYSS